MTPPEVHPAATATTPDVTTPPGIMPPCIYAGIDEAGYGPMFGPLVVGRSVLAVAPAGSVAQENLPPLWNLLSKAVCKNLVGRRGRIPVNDSKKLHTPSGAGGIKHLEAGVLTFASLTGHKPGRLDHWLACLGNSAQENLASLPWYRPDDTQPWQRLPRCHEDGELAIARNLLRVTADSAGVQVLDVGAAVVFEDEFNRMLTATRSKASVNFTFVARHLQAIWERFGSQQPVVVVDRQSGRTHYRELLQMTFPHAQLRVISEEPQTSRYELADEKSGRNMSVRFEVDADAQHMPTALASMVCKYTRELLMERFNAWFTSRLPTLRPTAGYALDAKRFWNDVQPHLSRLGISDNQLRRMA